MRCGVKRKFLLTLSDLNSWDYFIFAKIKTQIRNRHFRTVENKKQVVTNKLMAELVEDIEHCFYE